jgi:hypothetical protein
MRGWTNRGQRRAPEQAPIAHGATTRRMRVPTHSQVVPKPFPSSSQAFPNEFKANSKRFGVKYMPICREISRWKVFLFLRGGHYSSPGTAHGPPPLCARVWFCTSLAQFNSFCTTNSRSVICYLPISYVYNKAFAPAGAEPRGGAKPRQNPCGGARAE